jgi:hypothetical protein
MLETWFDSAPPRMFAWHGQNVQRNSLMYYWHVAEAPLTVAAFCPVFLTTSRALRNTLC